MKLRSDSSTLSVRHAHGRDDHRQPYGLPTESEEALGRVPDGRVAVLGGRPWFYGAGLSSHVTLWREQISYGKPIVESWRPTLDFMPTQQPVAPGDELALTGLGLTGLSGEGAYCTAQDTCAPAPVLAEPGCGPACAVGRRSRPGGVVVLAALIVLVSLYRRRSAHGRGRGHHE